MFEKLLAALRGRPAAQRAEDPAGLYSPYRQHHLDVLYNLCFCDDLDLYHSKSSASDTGFWKTLFADPPDTTALREIAKIHTGDIRITPNQNLVIANVPVEEQAQIEAMARDAGLLAPWSGLKRNSMACVALPTCGLALAESERYLPSLLDALDEQLAENGLSADDIVIRMTGCPNGCARPYLAEIGLVGKGPGRYNLYLGAAHDGSRLSKLYAEDLDHAGIVGALAPLFAGYSQNREAGEAFGDFCIRAGHVAKTGNGADFHANVRLPGVAA